LKSGPRDRYTTHCPYHPPKLDRIIAKEIRKDLEEKYQLTLASFAIKPHDAQPSVAKPPG
jgi:hypothetical protein